MNLASLNSLKSSAFVVALILFGPGLFAEEDKHVVIVGAGAAGLYAADQLEGRAGYRYTVLEASGRVGGRLGLVEGFADFPIDSGAEWLHGKKSVAANLCREQGVKFSKDASANYYWFEGKLKRRIPKNPYSLFEDKSVPDLSLSKLAESKGFSNSYQGIIDYYAGEYGASADDLGMKWTAFDDDKWSCGNHDYKFEDTYYAAVIGNLSKRVMPRVKLNSRVTSIDYSEDKIRLGVDGQSSIGADLVILTVPITVLKDGDIEFTPALPQRKLDAFAKIGMGPGMKVFMKFSQKFYQENTIGGSVCPAYFDQSIGKNGSDHVLLAFVMGDQAAALSALDSKQLQIKKLLTELDSIYNGKASASYIDATVLDWGESPYIRGAYSYLKVGAKNARAIAAEPIQNRIYFAGEAMNASGHPQTVHGAMETGDLAVKQILGKQ